MGRFKPLMVAAVLCGAVPAQARFVETRVSDAVSAVNSCFDAIGVTDLDPVVMKKAGWTRTAVTGSDAGFEEGTWSLKGRPTTMTTVRERGTKPLCGVTLPNATPGEFEALEAGIRASHGFSDEALRQDGLQMWVMGAKVISLVAKAEDGGQTIRVLVSRRDS